ncbi:MAG: hypothetical protein AYK19_14185 [Theionarchaea archaeon DG-70-1]|nr:MAG: hypothetical protein AYK19_14185 [Theionarchaea archaeon DG-70-1]
MTLERKISSIFKLDEEAWMRHANPLSVWSRFTVLPIIILAFWSRIWLNWWAALPIAISVIWMYINPRLFPKPGTTKKWASKGVLGERVWSNRDNIPVPDHHKLLPNILNAVAGVGGIFVIWGVYKLELWPVLMGCSLVYLGKLWFIDRMVWLYEDMKHLPEYKKWLY